MNGKQVAEIGARTGNSQEVTAQDFQVIIPLSGGKFRYITGGGCSGTLNIIAEIGSATVAPVVFNCTTPQSTYTVGSPIIWTGNVTGAGEFTYKFSGQANASVSNTYTTTAGVGLQNMNATLYDGNLQIASVGCSNTQTNTQGTTGIFSALIFNAQSLAGGVFPCTQTPSNMHLRQGSGEPNIFTSQFAGGYAWYENGVKKTSGPWPYPNPVPNYVTYTAQSAARPLTVQGVLVAGFGAPGSIYFATTTCVYN